VADGRWDCKGRYAAGMGGSATMVGSGTTIGCRDRYSLGDGGGMAVLRRNIVE
jgi:hypothetical protein